MITRKGFRTVKVSDIELPEDFDEAEHSPFLGDMAKSYDQTGGQPMEPIVLDSQLRLRAGRRRVAAAIKRGVKSIDAVMYDGTEEELAKLTDIENAMREHDPAARDAALARLVGQKIAERLPPGPRMAAGRPRTATGRAVAEVAKETGKPEGTVRRAVERSEKNEEPSSIDIPLRSYGVEIPKDVQENGNDCDTGLREIRSIVRTAKRKLGELEQVLGRTFTRIDEGLKQAERECGAELPVALCHACKAIKAVQQQCMTCGKQGYLGHQMAESETLAELKEAGAKAGVYYQGKWCSIEQARNLT